jgi:ATP phosphoribosyltransferase regulatory subunit HisZ
VLTRAGVPDDLQARFMELMHLHGDLAVLREAQKLVKGVPAAAAHLTALSEVAERLVELGLGPELGFDLGEIRGAAYYTGVSFALYAAGPGEVVASGGRYDALLGRYGMPQPATGAAIDLENLLWALDHAGQPWRERASLRLVLAGDDPVRNLAVADAVRVQGVPAATLGGVSLEHAHDYARAWGYDVALHVGASEAVARRTDGAEHKLPSSPGMSDIAALLAWARSLSKE